MRRGPRAPTSVGRRSRDRGGARKEQHDDREDREPKPFPEPGCRAARAAVEALPTCACGQALDTCRARCCPRCGIRVAAMDPMRSAPHRASYRGGSAMIGSAPAFGLLAGMLAVACTVPYVRDTLRGTTVPHRGSWLIWSVLEVVAVGAQRADGARWSLVPLVSQTVGTCLVFGLAVWLGSGGLSRVDLACSRSPASGSRGGWRSTSPPSPRRA